jgi:hypothetical protein
MAIPDSQYLDEHSTAVRLNAGRLWTGVVATAVVAVPLLRPCQDL